MKKFAVLMLALAVLCLYAAAQDSPAAPQEKKVFSYAYSIDDLPNGMRVITVPTDSPNLVALYMVVKTGSRNEVEPGKSGFAHLFEHLMFRGSKKYTPEQAEEVLRRAGASSNAYTTDDRTVYHAVFSKEDLDRMMDVQANAFQHLQYSRDAYKTETGAVLGEYNKNSANPISKLYEVLRETAYTKHTYSHTTMGYIKDIEDMPNLYDYSLEFYNRYYRPEYVTMLAVGDVQRDQVLALAKKHYGDWKRGSYVAQIPAEPPQTSPQVRHVDWPTPTLPWVVVAYRGAAYSDSDKQAAALDLLANLAFGQNSDLYQKLVLKEQKVATMDGGQDMRVDPELFAVMARVKDVKDVNYVRDQILATYKQFAETLVPADRLAATRSRMRYDFALSMDSSSAIAGALAPYIALRSTPETINRRYALYEQVSPEDIREAARKFFTEHNQTVVTLSTKANSSEKGGL
ncbi:MAG TPA: pitrilysin family protein [Clostridia bacterium]|nr:pitrilysin family protein [Clostridia bacterium]